MVEVFFSPHVDRDVLCTQATLIYEFSLSPDGIPDVEGESSFATIVCILHVPENEL